MISWAGTSDDSERQWTELKDSAANEMEALLVGANMGCTFGKRSYGSGVSERWVIVAPG